MKIALFHNFMDNIGGAEMVSLTLARHLKADIYSTNVDRDKIAKMGFSDVGVFSIGRVPLNAPFRQQAALMKFRHLNLGKRYDRYIIGGDWALAGAYHNKPSLWYVHSPIREIWDLYEYTRQNTVAWSKRWLFDAWVVYNRSLNRKYIAHASRIVCNSHTTQERVARYLGRESEVVYPPIATSNFYYKKNKGFWLSVNRLITHKRIELQLEAFRKLPHEQLIIVGSYEKSRHFQAYADHIQRSKPSNVSILSWVEFKQLQELYATCKGLIATSIDEDFGMNAIEAMAAGKPVIAPAEGGYKETVIDGVTGMLIPDITSQKLASAIQLLGERVDTNPQRYLKACQAQAARFDTSIFIRKITSYLK